MTLSCVCSYLNYKHSCEDHFLTLHNTLYYIIFTEDYAGYSGSGYGWVMHSSDGIKSGGSQYRPGEWEGHSGNTPSELMYGDDEDY